MTLGEQVRHEMDRLSEEITRLQKSRHLYGVALETMNLASKSAVEYPDELHHCILCGSYYNKEDVN